MTESEKAFEKYGHFNSTHEVYGVMMEEVAEFFEIVREKPGTENKIQRMMLELHQIESICERARKELRNDQIKFV